MSEPPTTNHEPRESNNEPRTTNNETDESSLLDLLVVLAKHKWLILGLPFVTAILAAIYSLTLSSIYTATTKILPPQQNQSAASAMLAQLGNMGALAGARAGSSNSLFIAMLKSRPVVDNLIQRFGLMKPGDKYPSQVREGLAGATSITGGSDGLITIAVNDTDPKRAADLANAYVDELNKLTNVLAVTEASQRRLFFERQLVQARDRLAKAEIAFKQALEKGGIVQVEGQGRAMLEATARLRGEITAKEIQISAMRTFAAERNPDLYRTQQELESMKRELAKIEGAGGLRVATAGARGQGMESSHLLRDLKYYETTHDLLAKQYEVSKIDEAKDPALIQVLEKAIEPDFKSGPKRRPIVLFSALAAGLVALLWAFAKEALDRARGDPAQSRRLRLFRSYLIGR